MASSKASINSFSNSFPFQNETGSFNMVLYLFSYCSRQIK